MLSRVPKHRKAAMALGTKCVCSIHFVQASVTVVACEFRVNELIIYTNKVSLNRNIHETKLGTDQLKKM